MSAGEQREGAKHFFADPTRYIKNNPYVELRAKMVRQMLPSYARKSILDLGAGNGLISTQLVGDRDDLLLVDSSARMLELALQNVPPSIRSQVHGLCIDAAQFVPTRTFDVVLCIGLLAHIGDWVNALRLIERCVGPNGCALVQLTDDDYYLGRVTRRIVDFNRRFHERSLHSLNQMALGGVQTELERLGLTLATVRRYVLVPATRFVPQGLARTVIAVASSPPFASYGGEVLALFVRK